MQDLMAARLTMAGSLAFHIVFASIGMIMPFLMSAAHGRWLRTGDADAYRLCRAWGRGVAIFFAVGAVSGTALSFELGLLWPGFMEHAGPIIGMPFSLEGTAFFVEAIALGIFLYGWGRVPPKVHFGSGIVVGIAGVSSGILVIAANGWMNSPTGFTWKDGQASDIDPWAAMLNAAWLPQAFHMVLAAACAVGLAVAGVHALKLARGRGTGMDRLGLRIALIIGCTGAALMPVQGHSLAQTVAVQQPLKLAAMEGLFETQRRAPLLVGGVPDEATRTVRWGIALPGLLSVMTYNDVDAEVQGLDAFPETDWPPVAVTHLAFQVMVGIGSLLLAFAGLTALMWKTGRLLHPRFLLATVAVAPLGFVAIQAGWIVTEVGRQPWIIYGIMRTADALTPVPGQVWHLLIFALLYTGVGVAAVTLWRRHVALGAPDVPAELEAWRQGGWHA